MTQLDAGDRTCGSRYGRTLSPLPDVERDELVERLRAAGLPHHADLCDPGEPVEGATSASFLRAMRDGVRVALEVHLPPLQPGERLPTCLRSTRYWRSVTGSPVKEHFEALEVQRWLRLDFALIRVDVRGTGASFGQWARAWDDEQRDDLVEVLDWVVSQPWSDGTVGGYGTSYDGSTAHLLAATGHPAVRAVVPRFALYDSYADILAPGGVPLDHFLQNWSAINWALDGHPERGTVPLPIPLAGSVQPVDDDTDGRLLAAAQAEHASNWDLWRDVTALSARQDLPGVDLGNGTPLQRISELRNARVPMWLWSSWYDGAYAAAQLRQLADPELDVRVTIGPFSHGASFSTLGDPLQPDLPNIPVRDQVDAMAAYLRHHLTGKGEDPSPAALHYYRLGDGWKAAEAWPPADARAVRHGLGGGGALGEPGGSRQWTVDRSHSTGSAATRWHGLIGGTPVAYADRRTQDGKALVWQGDPLAAPLGITGTPVVHLDVTSSAPDLALHVYLEAALPDGFVLYLTEGVLRASHRCLPSATRTTTPADPRVEEAPRPLTPGVPESLEWEMFPISVLLPVGSRIRVSLAGADTPLFRRIPAAGDVQLEVHGSSWIELPQQA